MNGADLLDDVWQAFLSDAAWPSVKSLQVRCGHHQNIRLLASEIGTDLIICEEGRDAKCWLTLNAVDKMPGGKGELAQVAAALRFVAETYVHADRRQITHDMFAAALRLEGAELTRMGLLLRQVQGPWESCGWSPDGREFGVNPNDDALFFSEVESLASVQVVIQRLEQERTRIRRQLGLMAEGLTSIGPLRTKWSKVNRQIDAMQSALASATNEERCQAVGFIGREVLISLSQEVYDSTRHPIADGAAVSETDAKKRLDAYFAAELKGSASETARAHAKAAVALANALLHQRTATRRAAALSFEATKCVIALAHVIATESTAALEPYV
jgi:hypothetical protein